MDFCGEMNCDIIWELQRRHMPTISEKILCQLDLVSVKNVRLVSKAWLSAVSNRNNKIWKNLLEDNDGGEYSFNTDCRRMTKHLKLDFPIPVEHDFYYLRLCNTVHFGSKAIDKAWLEPADFTIDYLPHSFPESMFMFPFFHFEMNEMYLVDWDARKEKMNYWSRRSLTSPPRGMLVEITDRYAGRNFCLAGDKLIVGCAFDKPEIKDQCVLSKHQSIFFIELNGQNVLRGLPHLPDGGNQKKFYQLHDTTPLGLGGQCIRYLKVGSRFLLAVFAGFSPVLDFGDLHVFVWELKELIDKSNPLSIKSPWKSLKVPFSSKDYFFMDEDYLVVLSDEDNNRSTFSVFSMLQKETGPPKEINSFDLDFVCIVQYSKGFLATWGTLVLLKLRLAAFDAPSIR